MNNDLCFAGGQPSFRTNARPLGTSLFVLALVSSCLFIAGCGTNQEGPRPAVPAPAVSAAPASVSKITTPTGIEMVLIPAGEFSMGSANGEEDEKPAHIVKVDSFYMDACEVTQKSFEELMGKNPSKSKDPAKPVEQLSWLSAAKYCNARSKKEGLEPCYNSDNWACYFTGAGYRLPTEAEWEYACRAGTASKYSFGDKPGDLSAYGWFKDNSGGTTHPAGQKQPNPWGLYDMHGNVWEWCHDRYGEDYYTKGEKNNPQGPSSGDDRVLRGGGFNSQSDSCRSSTRYSEAPGLADVCFGYDAYGFRCVRKFVTPAPPLSETQGRAQ